MQCTARQMHRQSRWPLLPTASGRCWLLRCAAARTHAPTRTHACTHIRVCACRHCRTHAVHRTHALMHAHTEQLAHFVVRASRDCVPVPTWINGRACAFTHAHACTCMRTKMRMHACESVSMHAHMHTHARHALLHAHARTYARAYGRAYANACAAGAHCAEPARTHQHRYFGNFIFRHMCDKQFLGLKLGGQVRADICMCTWLPTQACTCASRC